jgi:predicted Ser/Thr protein kinase
MRKCPKCSREFSDEAAGGLCPACLFQQGIDSETAVTASSDHPSASNQPSESAVQQPMSSEQLMSLLPQFDQIELIGRGGMGVVYRARQKNLDRPVALKVLSPELATAPGFAQRFAREARAMARLSHPNIVAVHDFGIVDNAGVELCYFTMEYVDGSNLRGLLKQLSSAQALAIIPQVCEALQYAHDIGIIHRDVKPENILVDKKGRVKIADFGLAKLLQQAKSATDYTLTQGGLVMGTPSYMAPEQLERPTEVDHRADLYSLGVVFYEMLTGQLPKGRFALPSQKVQIDVRFDEIVLKALEHDRELRYQHASEVRTSVESVRGTSAAQQQVDAAPPISIPAAPDRTSAAGIKPAAAAPPAPPARLSRMAIVASLFLLVGIFALVVDGVMAIVILGKAPVRNDHLAASWREQDQIVLLAVLIVPVLAGMVMTLLGAIAVVQIRREPQKLYGLRLALFDALLCPLLLLDFLVVGLAEAVLAAYAGGGKGGGSVTLSPAFFFLLPLVAILVDPLIYWWIWKKLRVATPASHARPAEAPASANKLTSQDSPATAASKPIAQASLYPAAREPKKFYTKAFGLYCVGWIAFLLLWNLGWPAMVAWVIIFSILASRQAKYLQKFRPEIQIARAREPRWIRIGRPSNFNAAFLVAFALLLAAVGPAQDTHYSDDLAKSFGAGTGMSDATQNFLKNYQAQDGKALTTDVRDLSLTAGYGEWPSGMSFGIEKPPELESSGLLPKRYGMLTLSRAFLSLLVYPAGIPPEFRIIPNVWILSVMGLYFFAAGFADFLGSKGLHFSGLAWRPALLLTALLAGAYIVAAFISGNVFNSVGAYRMGHGQFITQSTEFQILPQSQPTTDGFFTAVDHWAVQHGYEICAIKKGYLVDSHRLPEVNTNVTYRSVVLWKPGLFDRLGVDWDGFYSKAPELLVQSAGTSAASYTWITLPNWPRNKIENNAGNELQKSLFMTIKQDLATTQPSQ